MKIRTEEQLEKIRERDRLRNKLPHRKAQMKQKAFQARLKKYNITPETLDELKRKSDNTCYICGGNNQIKELHIDHNHLTGEVRGLLCFRCNFGLGWFQDQIAIFQRIREYLKNNIFPEKTITKIPKSDLKNIHIGFQNEL